jgi:hypothetical protein
LVRADFREEYCSGLSLKIKKLPLQSDGYRSWRALPGNPACVASLGEHFAQPSSISRACAKKGLGKRDDPAQL